MDLVSRHAGFLGEAFDQVSYTFDRLFSEEAKMIFVVDKSFDKSPLGVLSAITVCAWAVAIQP